MKSKEEIPAEETSSPSPVDSVAKDPVCGMTVRPDSPHRLEHAGHLYLFCSAGCLAKFQADPGRYLGSKTSAAPEHRDTQLGDPEYLCPMHPEIVHEDHGS